MGRKGAAERAEINKGKIKDVNKTTKIIQGECEEEKGMDPHISKSLCKLSSA